MTFKKGMRPVHPDEALRGEVLREEYLKLLGLSANALAKALRLSASRIGASFWSAGVSLPIPLSLNRQSSNQLLEIVEEWSELRREITKLANIVKFS